MVVDGRIAAHANLGSESPDVAERHPGVPGADRSGWGSQVDLRAVEGSTATLLLLARVDGADWVELDRREVRVEEPGTASAKEAAVFTIARNEPVFLPLWLRYYGRHFDPADIYVLDHDSSDGSTADPAGAFTRVPIHRDRIFDHMWLKGTVEDFQAFLLRSYGAVLFAEVDELVIADPSRYSGLGAYVGALDGPAACCTGYSVVHYPDEGERPLDFERPVLAQRRYWHRSPPYSKRLLGRIPLAWNVGFHQEFNAPDGQWSEEDVMWNLGWHRRVVEPDEFRDWFFHGEDLGIPEREEIPERLKTVL